jgi:hypothetical protein
VIIPLMGLLAVLSPALAGGRLGRLGEVRFRHTWVVLVALAAQVVAISVLPRADHTVLSGVHLATYAAAGAFVWLNRTVPGLLVVAAGAASNGVTIAVNGGTLPASQSALERAGLHLTPGEFLNSGVLEHPRLGFLGDVFAVPEALPLSNVFSVGDVVIVVGVAWGAHRICRSRLVPAWMPAELPTARVGRHRAPAWSPRASGPSTVLPTEGGPVA